MKHSIPTRAVFDLVLKHGAGSTSFLTLYDGFEHFTREIGGELVSLAYVDTPTAWVGAGAPVGPAHVLRDLLTEFAAEARRARKAAVLLPVSEELARFARTAGFYALQIGSEPWLLLDSFINPRSDMLPTLYVARQLHSKGAIVEKFDPTRISAEEHLELDQVTQRWLGSHKARPLSFLNRVEPWLYAHQKMYFRVRYHGHQVGFLAAVPVPARNSWYLVDLIRSPDSPLGTTELLILEAVEWLKKVGAQEVTLGMAPLVPVKGDERRDHPRIYRMLEFVFEHLNFVYHFKPLHTYKEKFRPTRWEPQYLIALSSGPGWKGYYGIFRALAPVGVLRTLAAIFWRNLKAIPVPQFSPRFLSDRVVLCTPPEEWGRRLVRCKGVLMLAVANVLLFWMSVDPLTWLLRPRMVKMYAYSWQRFAFGTDPGGLFTPIFSSFLHWNWTHLAFNMAVLLIACGFLEVLAGSAIFGATFLAGVLFSNPLTSVLVGPALLFDPALFRRFTQEIDVGSSLGCFACLGALAYFFRSPKAFLSVLTAAVGAYCYLSGSILGLNHLTSLALGYGVARYYVPKT